MVPSLDRSSNSTSCSCGCTGSAILYGRSKADLAVTGGVHTAADVLKAMMAGARVAMMTSALLQARHRAPGMLATELLTGWASTSTSRSGRCRAA